MPVISFLPSSQFPLVVETVAGRIEGKEGKISHYFKGIPYAEAAAEEIYAGSPLLTKYPGRAS